MLFQKVNIVLILGYIVTGLGAFLLAGNIFHFFPTFPMAGAITMFVGGLIVKKAKG